MKHKINVPKGCKVVSVETTDEMVVVKFEKEENEFKENDIVTCETEGIKWVAIFKEKINCSSFRSKAVYAGSISISDWTSYGEKTTLATDSEKQLLFDKLKEKCLMFDGKDIVRWRAEPYQKYFYLPGDGDIAETKDDMSNWDDGAYHIGNYFPTREMAEEFQKQYIDLLNNFHKKL
ncbi:MAG: hypothetical protein AB7G87_10035 [Clostridia bacterium]